MRIRIAGAAFAVTLAAAGVMAAPGRAHSALLTRTYSGTGWKIANDYGVQYLGPNPWKIQFYDTASRTALTPYAKRTAAELTKDTGVTFTVTTTITQGTTSCPGGRVIIMRLTDTITRSGSSHCHTLSGAADGSRATFALSTWNDSILNGSHEIFRRKVVSHELGHGAGLSHPATWTTNPTPLMRGDVWGGYTTLAQASLFTAQDIKGFKALRANATKLPPTTAAPTVNRATQP